LGRESADSRSGRPLPLQFPAGVKIKAAAMGYNHGLAITTQGTSPVERIWVNVVLLLLAGADRLV
jgi:hypothetical protein